MKAIVMQGGTDAAYVTDRPEPKLRDDYVLVDVKAVAINPTDWKHVEFLNHKGLLSGCDYAGIVVDVGKNAKKAWKKGERVAGLAHGGNSLQPEDGAFAERIVARSGGQFRIPESMSYEEAATLGVAIITVGQGMYQQMKLNWPNNPTKSGEWILIYGGSSGMGTIGILFAKLSGYKVVTTCSPRNFDLAKSFGADVVFDYNDPKATEKINKLTNNDLKYVWDTISEESTAEFCSKVISAGGTHGFIGRNKPSREDIKIVYSLGYTAAGEAVDKGMIKVSAEDAAKDYEWMITWVDGVQELLDAGKIKAHPPKVTKGLENIIPGLEEIKTISGKKLVYTL